MSKANHRKPTVPISEQTWQGVTWAAEIIMDPRVLETFSSRALAAKELEELKPDEWAKGIAEAFRSRVFSTFLEQAISVAHKDFWSSDPAAALQFAGDLKAPDPRALAIVRAHRRLTADPKGPGWVTLGLFCLARAIAVNAKVQFERDVWDEATFLWFDLESRFTKGDGVAVAKLVVKANRTFFGNNLPEVVGSRMLHGLAEAAANTPFKAFFR